YMVAKEGQLPAVFAKDEIKGATGGLLITSLLVICFILFFDLAGIAMMGSGAFLLVYAAVNAGHLRILKQTGAKAWIVAVSLILCLVMFAILEVYTYRNAPEAVYTMIALLIGSFAAELIWQKFRKRA
ncbi:MAG: amino acid permease, partial [Ignavibacteria bacterium]|nr:amino acid permease [Ignavibacteria bacterium]